jgi:hypothetical protein
MADLISVLNTIRSNASADYQATVPTATRTNLTTIGSSILSLETNTNEFLDAFVNRIAFTQVQNKIFKNPLSVLKKGGVPMGDKIQEIYTNPAKGGTYDASSTDMLKVFKPDVKAAYYRINRQGKFPVTIGLDMLQRAFTDMQNLDIFAQSIINSMYNGDEIEQFELTKGMIAGAFDGGRITEINLYNENTEGTLTDEEIAKRIVKAIQTYSELMVFPSEQYNKFKAIKGGDATAVKTWTPKEDQILIIPSNVKVNMNVEVLSYAFNVSLQQFNQQTLTIDSFVDKPILGLLCDKACFQIYDNLIRLKSFDNGDTLQTHYYFHHHQTFGFSLLANSIVFTYTPKTV